MQQNIKIIIFLFAFLTSGLSRAQSDSAWTVFVLKKGHEPIIRDNMAGYSNSGFYLYQNCLYTFSLIGKKPKTGRLVALKPDTLFFQMKGDSNNMQVVAIDSLESFLFSDNWTPNQKKKIKIKKHQFVFTKSNRPNFIPSNFAFITPDQEKKYELIPSPTLNRICYFTYFEGLLLYHSGVEIDPPKYTAEEKEKALKAVLTVLDAVVNKRVIISVEKKSD